MPNRPIDRPYVTLKLATSLDGRIATRTGASQWITSVEARAKVHQLRAEHDCILTGIGTILADNPLMTARTNPPPDHQPIRALLDSMGRVPVHSQLMATANLGPLCLFHDRTKGRDMQTKNIKRFGVTRHDAGLDLPEVLAILGDRLNVRRVMVEAGSRVAGAFLKARLVDQIIWFRAPIIIGGDGLSVLDGLGVEALNQAILGKRESISPVGADMMETYRLSSFT